MFSTKHLELPPLRTVPVAPGLITHAQSGGVTAVINASACGVIETARKHSDKIGTVYAGQNGIIGALTENLIDTSKESDADISALKHTPSGGFGSCRYKMKSLEDNSTKPPAAAIQPA
jgi:6-phosphofructokinase 1